MKEKIRMELLVVVSLMMQSQRTTSEIVGAQWGITEYILMLNIRLWSQSYNVACTYIFTRLLNPGWAELGL